MRSHCILTQNFHEFISLKNIVFLDHIFRKQVGILNIVHSEPELALETKNLSNILTILNFLFTQYTLFFKDALVFHVVELGCKMFELFQAAQIKFGGTLHGADKVLVEG